MTKGALLVVVAAVVSGCAAESGGAPEDEGPSASASEALVYTGYCRVGADGRLTGTCVGGSNLCTQVSDSECPAGRAAASPASVLSYCYAGGRVTIDTASRCTYVR